MNSKTLFLLLSLVLSLCVQAQSISVKSFRLLESDLTANTVGTMEKDQNGDVAALIKVVTTETGFTFDGGALGIVKTRQMPAEIWVYVPRGLKKITISHPQLGILRDYFLPVKVEAARTYEMALVTGKVETTVREARTSQYVVFQLTPPNAVVELDGELLQTTDGTARKVMKFGSYNYRVQAPLYLPEAGFVTVNDPTNKHVVNINLKPNFTTVTITADGNAEIWVDGELKGAGTWTGPLGIGTYEIEARKQNYRSTSITPTIEFSSEPKTFHLQAPTPIYTEADIDSSPSMADVYIDGKNRGKTPLLLSDLLIGEHQVTFVRKGYADYTDTVTVREGETFSLSATLVKAKKSKTSDTQDSAFLQQENDDLSRQTFKVGNVEFTMICVDGGSFRMGGTSEQGSDVLDNERPVHLVTVSSCYIGETEVTQALWEAVMGKNPSYYKGANKPVETVSWSDCQTFIEKLNKKTGLQFRMLTEAEWEFAARGGNKSKGYKYSGSNTLSEIAWYGVNSEEVTHDVKSKQPNELGLYDMSGNVAEWCQDKYGKYTSNSQTNPTGPDSGYEYLLRGGSWFDDSEFCRVAFRNYSPQKSKVSTFGLRLAL